MEVIVCHTLFFPESPPREELAKQLMELVLEDAIEATYTTSILRSNAMVLHVKWELPDIADPFGACMTRLDAVLEILNVRPELFLNPIVVRASSIETSSEGSAN